MALNRTKVLEAAQKYLQKGQHDKAIAEYQKLVKEDPRDVRTLLKIGDLHTRRGNTEAAIETYGQVAEQYAKQGFFLKAVAVYKQILKLNPEQLDVCEKLAAMYEELALVSDALKTYEAVSDGYARSGKIDKSLDTMQKMIDLDPDNIAVRIKYAEALSKAEKADDAAEAFAAGAALLRDQGRMDDYIRVAERQLYHQPTNGALAKELSSLYLERKDAKRALAKLQLCFKNDPRDIQTLEMLAEAFRQLGQGTKTISVLREIARIHADLGAEEPRKRALGRILDLDPDDQEARQALGVAARGQDRKFGATMIDTRSAEERAEAAAARDADEDEIEEVSDAELLVDGHDDEVLIVDEEVSASKPPSEPKPEREPETQEQRVARLLEEADMQASAGFWLEVEGLLEEVLELVPDELRARERLKDLYLQLERDEEAVAQLLLLADACAEQDVGRALGYMQHAVRLAPDDPRPRLRLEALEAEQSLPPAEPVASEPPDEDATATVAAADDPLEQPISPGDFDSGPPPVRSSLPPADIDAMLDAPIEDDFDAPAPAAPTSPPPAAGGAARSAGGRTMDSLPRVSDVDDLLDGAMESEPPRVEAVEPSYGDALDAPIEDDFGAPPPKRESAAPADAERWLDAPIEDDFDAIPPPRPHSEAPPMSMLDAPIEDDFGAASDAQPADDFGLADPRFDESDIMEADMLGGTSRPEASTEGAAEPAPLDEEDLPLMADEVTAESEIPGGLLARQAEKEFGPGEAPAEISNVDDDEEIPLLLDSEAPPDSITVVPGPPDEVATAAEEAIAEQGSAEQARSVAEQAAAPSEPGPAPDDIVTATGDPEPDAFTAPPPPPPGAEVAETDPEIEEAVDEADFFFQQGMVDEAIEAVQEALLIYPDNALLLEKLAAYEKSASEQAEAASPAEDEGADETFKFAEQLAEQLGELPEDAPGEAIDVEQVFAQFKKGVAEQVSADDSATHFDLGIAYKEMGLVDDAINEFRVAASDPVRECMARTMIGMCMMEQGDAPSAIEEFRGALASEQKDARAELGLHYEIGTANQMLGDLPAALSEFEKVAESEPRFRDVQKKLDELRAQVPRTDSDSEDSDALDRAFDDLMGDGD